MIKLSFFIYITFIVSLIACEKEPRIYFGFDSPIDKNSKGLVIADISQNVEKIYLKGFIGLAQGEVEINLVNPNGFAVYSKTIIAPVEVEINETFNASNGYWRLKYKSHEGIGEIDLHLH